MYQVEYKVKNLRTPAPLEELHIGGRIEKQMELFLYERVSSEFAKEFICAETEKEMIDRVDDVDVVSKWRGEFWGKWVISAARVARYHNDACLKEFLRQSAYRVIATADEDGYIGSFKDKENIFPCDPAIAKARGIHVPWNWNIWGRKYTLWGLLEIYELTGDEKILEAAHKSMVQLMDMLKKLGVHIQDTGAFFGLPSGSIMKPVLILYRHTGDARLLELALEIANDWEDPNGRKPNLIANALAMKPVHTWYDESFLWAKAYEMMSCLDGLLELYRVTGVEKYLTAVENMHQLLREYELNVIFSVGFNDIFANAATLQNSLTEPCDVIHWMRLSYELYCLTGKNVYMENFELAFYNPFLAGSFYDGKWGARAVRSFGRPHEEGPHCGMHFSHCCVNNMPRGYMNAVQSYVMYGEDGLYINLYSDFDGIVDGVKLTIGGSLFADGKVSICVDTASAKKLHLRIPAWSKKTKIDGKVYADVDCVTLDAAAGKREIAVEFDMTPVIREFPYPVEVFELPDFRIRRYLQCNPIPAEQMRWERSATLMYGPLLLTRSKLVGNTEKEMFEDASIFGKGLTAKVIPVACEDFAGNVYRVEFEGKGGFETTFCDFANGSNHISRFDTKLYSIFV